MLNELVLFEGMQGSLFLHTALGTYSGCAEYHLEHRQLIHLAIRQLSFVKNVGNGNTFVSATQ